jgi:hypothetical protein
MARPPMWSVPASRFRIVLASVALLLFVVEQLNGRFWMNDFRVYYGAAQALLAGEALYGVAHGLDSGLFKYAPFMALVYVPFALLPYGVAASLQYLLIAGAFIGAVLRADRLLRTHLLHGRAAAHLPLFLTALVGVVHLHRELHLGNINVMLLWLLLLALEQLLNGRERSAGLLIGLALLAKPHFAILLPLLALRGRIQVLVTTILVVVAGLLVPGLFLGLKGNTELLGQWLDVMGQHNAALIYTGGDAYEAVNTVYSLLWRSLLQHLGIPPAQGLALAILALIAVAFAALLWMDHRRGRDVRATLLFQFLLLVALVPSLTLTDTEHFLFALPLVAWLLHHLVPRADPRWLAFLAMPILFAYGGNWEDALGPMSRWMVHHGVLGAGNMGLVILSCYLYFRPGSNTMAPGTS